MHPGIEVHPGANNEGRPGQEDDKEPELSGVGRDPVAEILKRANPQLRAQQMGERRDERDRAGKHVAHDEDGRSDCEREEDEPESPKAPQDSTLPDIIAACPGHDRGQHRVDDAPWHEGQAGDDDTKRKIRPRKDVSQAEDQRRGGHDADRVDVVDQPIPPGKRTHEP